MDGLLIERKAIAKLNEIIKKYKHDEEAMHGYADDVLIDTLKKLGYSQVAEKWEKMKKEEDFRYS